MFTLSRYGWIALLLVLLLSMTIFLIHTTTNPSKKPKKEELPRLGAEKETVQQTSLFPITFRIVPVRKQINMWITKVPLTPFRAPLRVISEIIELPKFLLYNPLYLSPVRNQGNCGSCFAFAVCDMLSDRLSLYTNTQFKSNLSVQQILDCMVPDGCEEGGSPEEVCMALAKSASRLRLDSAYNYVQFSGGISTNSCSSRQSEYEVQIESDSVSSIVTFIDEKNPDTDILVQNITNMKHTLHKNGPFYCAMTIYDDFMTYDGLEPYRPSNGAELMGGHAVEIVGYCDMGENPNYNVGYWICKNSWGSGDWPTRAALTGYFMIVMGENVCGIESRCGQANPILWGPELNTTNDNNDFIFTSWNDYYKST